MTNAHEAEKEYQAKRADSQTADADQTVASAIKENKRAAMTEAETKWKRLNDIAAQHERADEASIAHEIDVQEALISIYKANQDLEDAIKAKEQEKITAAKTKLAAAKDSWRQANSELQAIGTKNTVAQLEVGGIQTAKTTIDSRMAAIDQEITDIQLRLSNSNTVSANAPSLITGVAADKTLVHANDDALDKPGAALAALGKESADAWTNISFSVGSQSDSSSTKESSLQASANVSVGRWWAKVSASTSVSTASKNVQSKMSSCQVNGSFSAMVVNIKRPWLHSDLFQDFDIDIPSGTKLSPGAEQIKYWVDNGDPGTGQIKRTDYGKFPAYPTAFIVAADTVLEFTSQQKDSEEMMKSLSTDSSIQASYGPWGLSCGASAKTSNSESSQKMEVKDGSLRIAFQAPQIIGWVSEILPQLPRGGDIGGLVAPPNKAFRV